MRWNYDDNFRDEFSKGPHRDILIVPHGTKVTPVAGGPPIITSKVPVFKHGYPEQQGGEYVMSDVDWVITNNDIVKEKFKYSFSLNPADNITFSSACSAMVQFTIRNNKEYNPDTDTWELDIPNLQYYSYYDEDGNPILGELEGNYIIKVYTYINGDSSTLLLLGMFRVEEDKAVDDGYNRQITAYDFMATFRDMDIFNWYKHLFEGINKLDNDYLDATNKTGEETKKPDKYDSPENWIRSPQEEWTVKDALIDLIDNLAAFDMIVYDENGNALVGNTTTNPSDYGRDYGDGCGRSGLGMPVMLDPNILDPNSKPYTPTDSGPNEYEEYGYMKILELKFRANPSIMKSESLSMGKFLEDLGLLAGRYPFIRPDKLLEDASTDYHDPSEYSDKENRYNNYEKCILSFKPLPSSKDDKTKAGITKLQPEQQFTNNDIVKGFKHSLFDVKDVMVIKIGMNDGETIQYQRLNKSQQKDAETQQLQTFSFSNNLFASYLVDSSDDEEIKTLIPEYTKIKENLFGKEKGNHNMTAGALFEEGYLNVKYRNYTPYELTTYGDPCRDVGDRILINFTDIITGETTSFYSYILERELNGIQKMMDTYKANGAITSPVFSNYQAGTKYESGSNFLMQMLGYRHSKGNSNSTNVVGDVTPSDLVEYLRNVGIRLLDEPIVASAKFIKGSGSGDISYLNFYGGVCDPDETWDGETPVQDDPSTHGLKCEYWNEELQEWGYHDITSSGNPIAYMGWRTSPYSDYPEFAFYTVNSKWEFFGKDPYDENSPINDCGYPEEWKSDPTKHWVFEPNDLKYGDTTNVLKVNGQTINIELGDVINIDGYNYEHLTDDVLPNLRLSSQQEEPEWNLIQATYQYPGVWVDCTSGYPDLHENSVVQDAKNHVELKWEDPGNATKYEPYPAEWQRTVIIRKEDSPPLNRWDGVRVVYNTTKDQYKDNPYKDEDIELGKVYYYGFFPYYKKTEIDGHAIRYYRFAKVIRVETNISASVPEITDISNEDGTVTIFYTIPDGTYTSIKLYGRIGENPKCNSTDDIIEDINQNDTSISVENLECEEYYFCIQAITADLTLSSNVVSIDLSFNWDGSEITILWSGDDNRMTAELIESNGNKYIKFRMYLSDTLIYQFIGQYVDESLSRTVKDINIGFLIDENNQIGRPSNIYYVSDENDTNYQKYIYNASDETPSDSEMENIYTWLDAGMD